MNTYVLMTKLSPEAEVRIKDRAKLGRKWLEQVREKCPEVHFTAHYALLGPYDFLDIYEAPDDESAAAVMLRLGSFGNVRTQTLRAFTSSEIKEIISKVPG